MKINGIHVDFEYLSYDKEKSSSWRMIKKWDRSYSEILHDTNNLIKQLIEDKCRIKETEKRQIYLRPLLFNGKYLIKIVAKSWKYRKDVLSAYNMLNIALNEIIKPLFIINNEFVPFKKMDFKFYI